MKKVVVLWSSFFIFLIIFPTFLYIFANFFFEKNFVFSRSIHSTLEKIFGENNDLLFKKGDFYYKMGMYHEALENYLGVECQGEVQCQKLYHNIGNTYFRLGEIKIGNEKILFLQKSLQSYKKSLEILFHPETKKNHDYVEKLLQELIQKEEPTPEEQPEHKPEENKPSEIEKNSDSSENNTENESTATQEKDQKSGSGTQQKDEKTDDTQSDDTKKQSSNDPASSASGSKSQEKSSSTSTGAGNDIIPKGPTIDISQKDLDVFSEVLTPEEKKQIEDYIEQLKQEEKENIHLNKPTRDRNIFDILTEDFSHFGSETQDW